MTYRDKAERDKARARIKSIMAAEAARVQGLIAQDRQDTLERQQALLDPDGERRLERPTDAVRTRRAVAANGMSEAEVFDTIGKLWTWGLLDGGQFDADLMRDAGRRYAAVYWHRYGAVCAAVGAYGEMVSARSSGPKQTFIADPDADLEAEDAFRRRDEALCRVGAKRQVDQVCVDGAGDNDPGWLIELMLGFPTQTRNQRAEIAAAEAEAMALVGEAREKALRRIRKLERALRMKLGLLRVEVLPQRVLASIRLGLDELVRIDAGEGWHRKPKRAAPRDPDEEPEAA